MVHRLDDYILDIRFKIWVKLILIAVFAAGFFFLIPYDYFLVNRLQAGYPEPDDPAFLIAAGFLLLLFLPLLYLLGLRRLTVNGLNRFRGIDWRGD